MSLPFPQSPHADTTHTAHITLDVRSLRLELQVCIPPGPMPAAGLEPLAWALAEVSGTTVMEDLTVLGRSISCKAGCGACCRQLVPISPSEAQRIRQVVEALPEPRRAQVLERFAAIRARLAEVGLLDRLLDPPSYTPTDKMPLGDEYFALRLPCPFLEQESCSIHAERPLACREYLVVSPPEHCCDPRGKAVEVVRQPLPVWHAFLRTDRPTPENRIVWQPLSLLADDNDQEPATEPGPEMLRRFIAALAE